MQRCFGRATFAVMLWKRNEAKFAAMHWKMNEAKFEGMLWKRNEAAICSDALEEK